MEKAVEVVSSSGPTKVIAVDERHREAYLMKRSGEQIKAIASKFGVDVRTIHRWLMTYEENYRKALEEKPMVNLIAEEVAKLDEMEHTARKLASASRSDAHCRGYLNLALKALIAKQQFLLNVGVLPTEPAKIYTTISSNQPGDSRTSSSDERSDEEIQQNIIELLKHARSL